MLSGLASVIFSKNIGTKETSTTKVKATFPSYFSFRNLWIRKRQPAEARRLKNLKMKIVCGFSPKIKRADVSKW